MNKESGSTDLPALLDEEAVTRKFDIQLVPPGGSAVPGELFLTNLRVIGRWKESGGLLRQAQVAQSAVNLETGTVKLPGGPLVVVEGPPGGRIAIQTFQARELHRAIHEAIHKALIESGLVEPDPPQPALAAECIRCSLALEPGARFCPSCGTYQAVETAYCRWCNVNRPAGERYCTQCSEPLINPGWRPDDSGQSGLSDEESPLLV